MAHNNNTPFFTIVIPSIGEIESLSKALESIHGQSFNNYEVIIVDNSRISEKQQQVLRLVNSMHDEKISVYSTDLIERSNARNLGIEKAIGKYVCFLDEDDILISNHLKIFYNKIEEEHQPIALLRTGMKYINIHGRQLKKSIPCPSNQNPVVFFLDHMVGIHTLCFHRSILNSVKFHPDYFLFEDTHLLIRALLEFPFIQIADHTCLYLVNEKDLDPDTLMNHLENNLACINDLFENQKDKLAIHINTKRWKKYMLQKKYLDYSFFLLGKDKKVSFDLFKKSIALGIDHRLLKRYILYFIKRLN